MMGPLAAGWIFGIVTGGLFHHAALLVVERLNRRRAELAVADAEARLAADTSKQVIAISTAAEFRALATLNDEAFARLRAKGWLDPRPVDTGNPPGT